MTTVTLTDEQLELLRRETMQQAVTDLVHLADHLERLSIARSWPAGTLDDDIANARSLAMESLGTLDALGWAEGTP